MKKLILSALLLTSISAFAEPNTITSPHVKIIDSPSMKITTSDDKDAVTTTVNCTMEVKFKIIKIKIAKASEINGKNNTDTKVKLLPIEKPIAQLRRVSLQETSELIIQPAKTKCDGEAEDIKMRIVADF